MRKAKSYARQHVARNHGATEHVEFFGYKYGSRCCCCLRGAVMVATLIETIDVPHYERGQCINIGAGPPHPVYVPTLYVTYG